MIQNESMVSTIRALKTAQGISGLGDTWTAVYFFTVPQL